MALVKVKTTVRPRSLVIMAAVSNVAQGLVTPSDVTITSGNDSAHMKKSKHYEDEALDVRSKNFPSRTAKLMFLRKVLGRLGNDYQGILEGEGTDNEHFHFEYDPGSDTPATLDA